MEGLNFALEAGEPFDAGADRAVVCRNGSEIIGHALIIIEGETAEIFELWVREDWREKRWMSGGGFRAGIAEKLIVNVEKMLRADGVTRFEAAGDVARAPLLALGWKRSGALLWVE